MACKESICRNCFHSYVCEQFNRNKDDNNEKCHFFNDHYVPTADVVPKSEVERLEQEIKALVAFKDYFGDLYGQGFEIANWHENGTLEPFDNFYEAAEDEYEAELKKKYTEVKDDKTDNHT